MSDGPIYVTRPSLPPLAEFMSMLDDIWRTRVLTNHGPYHQQFEDALESYLGVPNVSLTANGMIALETAIETATLSGEVITTPFSFVATAHAISRAGLIPVFVDVRRGDLNIDPNRIEEAITDRTSAIVAVHCYGNPCAVKEIEDIARRRNLKVIYDAAHAFGVHFRGRSLLSFGDLSVLSFHATKVFNTFEGGAIVAKRMEDKQQVSRLCNFGILDEVTVALTGGNGKMSEFQAALGLLQLKYFEQVRLSRAIVDDRYRQAFAGLAGIELISLPEEVRPNYSYFPILVNEKFRCSRDQLYDMLKAQEVYSRRYFYPLLANMPMYRDLLSSGPNNLPIAIRAAEQILCLPIYADLQAQDQDRVIQVICNEGA